MYQLIVLNIELEAIRSFLQRVSASVDAEYLDLAQRAEAGEFTEEDQEDNAFFEPMSSEEIAIRSTLSELNALVDWEIQNLASEPLAKKQELDKSKRRKIVRDLKRDDLIGLIETYYDVTIEGLPNYGKVEEIRHIINAYKHRKGFKYPYKDKDWTTFPEKFRLERDEAFQYIDAVRNFLKELWTAAKIP